MSLSNIIKTVDAAQSEFDDLSKNLLDIDGSLNFIASQLVLVGDRLATLQSYHQNIKRMAQEIRLGNPNLAIAEPAKLKFKERILKFLRIR